MRLQAKLWNNEKHTTHRNTFELCLRNHLAARCWHFHVNFIWQIKADFSLHFNLFYVDYNYRRVHNLESETKNNNSYKKSESWKLRAERA